MRRREFIARLGGVAAVWPLAARAQVTGRHYRIAMLSPQRAPQSFFDELGQSGFMEGHNLELDNRGIGVVTASYEAVAVELTKARPDVFMVAGPENAATFLL